MLAPAIISRSEHIISRANISEHALKVLYRLDRANYQSLLVGGGVRDLLLGLEPKDFDIATNASPEQVNEQFRNCRLIGRRFRLAHIHFGRDIVEVATFRGGGEGIRENERTQSDEGRLLRDNVYGTLEEDVWRRDFTVNALYYNIHDFSVIDYVGGMEDLKSGTLRMIGDPEQRYREDPVRMLRAIRFAAKLGFRIHPDSEAPIFKLGHLLADIPPSRLFEEVLKLFFSGVSLQTFELLRHYHLFEYLFPQADKSLAVEENGFPHMLISKALTNTDIRVMEGRPVTPAFLYAALLWDAVRIEQQALLDKGEHGYVQALQQAGSRVVSRQAQSTSIPKRFSYPMREIWNLQPRFKSMTGMRPYKLLAHVRFRAAYDFLLLRAECGEVDQELADWWTKFQELSADEQKELTKPKYKSNPRRKKHGKSTGTL